MNIILFCKIFRISTEDWNNLNVPGDPASTSSDKDKPSQPKTKTLRNNIIKYVGKEKIKNYPFSSIYEKDIMKRILTKEEKIKIRNELDIQEEKVVLAIGQFIHILIPKSRSWTDYRHISS